MYLDSKKIINWIPRRCYTKYVYGKKHSHSQTSWPHFTYQYYIVCKPSIFDLVGTFSLEQVASTCHTTGRVTSILTGDSFDPCKAIRHCRGFPTNQPTYERYDTCREEPTQGHKFFPRTSSVRLVLQVCQTRKKTRRFECEVFSVICWCQTKKQLSRH